MTKRCLPVLALFAATLLVAPALQADKLKSSTKTPDSFLRIIELSGTPTEIGQSHGQQLAAEIAHLEKNYLRAFFAKNPQQHKQALMAAFLFRNLMNPDHKEEILAISDGAKLDAGQIMLANCFLDLIPITACSTMTLPADAAPDGIARFGRNLDFPSMDVADKYSVLSIIKPKGKYAFASIGWPALAGVLSGMNEHGLTLANMEVDRQGGFPQAMPYTLLYRTLLEQCKTVDEAIALLEKTPRQTANNLMLMDAAGNRAAIEITPEKISVRRAPAKSALVSTNHHRGEDCITPGFCRRYDYLQATSTQNYGKIGVDEAKSMLAKVSQGKMTLQSMVFEPSTRVIHLSVGAEAHKRAYHRIDLNKYFKKN